MMDGPESSIARFLALAQGIISLLALVLVLRFLSKKYPSDVNMVWYFFSLSHVISLLLFFWGFLHGAFDNGFFVGETGLKLNWLLDEFEDFEADASILALIVTVVVAPQLLTYIFSGLSGCATDFWLIGQAARFFSWGLIKFFSIAGGVSMTIGVSDFCFGISVGRKYLGLPTALFNISIAFMILIVYRCAEQLKTQLVARCPKSMLRVFFRLHAWASRSVKNNR